MKSVVFTFGRMNPPTTGHQLLVDKLVAYARQIGAAPRVYLSHSTGKKDPLQYDKKITFARQAFGAIVKKSNARNVIQILQSLEKEGYTHVVMFAGSDRVPEFKKLLNAYNGKEYKFDKIEVKSAGERDPDADDVSGMSASKMRALAVDNQDAAFMRGAPSSLKAQTRKQMFLAVRKALLGEDVMDYSHDDRFIEFIMEASDEEAITLPSDSEIAKMLDKLDLDDLDLDDADAVMLDVILPKEGEESEEEKKEEVKEARMLSGLARQKLSQRMKSISKRLAKLRQIKAKQMPAATRLRMRARKAALMILRRRATGKKNLDYASLSRSQRIAVDTALLNRFGGKLNKIVDTLAKRVLPKIRSKAQQNVAKAREIKEGSGVVYPGTTKPVPDQKKDNPLNLDALKIDPTVNDPTQNDRYAPDPSKADKFKNNRSRFKNVLNTEGRKSAVDKDARDPGDTNIIYQMRKIINSRGEHETTFADGKKARISVADAKKLLAKFDALRMPKDKHEFTIQAGRSSASFHDVLAHGLKPDTGKKVSLGGRNFKEFYMGAFGRNRTASPYPPETDEPPGIRRVAEKKTKINEASTGGVDKDANDDSNKPRKANPKLDLLLRLGLSDPEELQKYRRALRTSKKQALQSPEMRKKLADLLDKLIDLTTQDAAIYSRARTKIVTTKEAYALLRKSEMSGIDADIIAEVYVRGLNESGESSVAFDRVNSFIAGGKAAEMDKDLSEKVKEPTGGLKSACWTGYTAVGTKMKNGRRVPNCVPKEETNEATKQQRAARAALATQSGEYAGGKKGGAINRMALMRNKDLVKIARGKNVKEEAEQVDEISSAMLYRAKQAAQKKAGWLMPGDKGKGDKAWNRVRKFRDAGVAKEKQERAKKKTNESFDEAVNNWARARKDNERTSVGYLNYSKKKSYVDRKFTPYRDDQRKVGADAMKDFLDKGGTIQKVPAGKKTIKSYVKPKTYMTPNKAAKVGVSEQTSTHAATSLTQRTKRTKPFRAWEPKPHTDHSSLSGTNEANRVADVKLVKVRLPDGKMVYRRERAKAEVQHETYTGAEPTSSNKNDPANRFVGTDSIVKNYASVTPGQNESMGTAAYSVAKPMVSTGATDPDAGAARVLANTNQAKQDLSKKHLSDIKKALGGIRESNELNESFAAGFELAPFARDYGMTVQSSFTHHPEVQEALDAQEDAMNEAIYQGRDVPLNKPMKGDVKKSKVYVRDPSTGNIKKVNFGDKHLSIKKDQPARKKSYCARSGGQGNLTKKTSANYWSRRAWDC